DYLAQQTGSDMIRRPAEKTAGEFRPFAHRTPSVDQLLMTARQLPAAMDAGIAPGGWGRKGHALDIFWPRLIVVERCRRSRCIAECGMRGDVGDALAVDIDLAAVA